MAAQYVKNRMDVVAALQVLIDQRRTNQIVVTNQGSARVWPKLSQHALDFHYNPSTMGGAIPLALGLALAQQQCDVLVVSGDGALLMSLGSLVTVIGAGVTNLTVVVMDNGRYEVTGGQKTPAVDGSIDFAGLAKAAGFRTAFEFSDVGHWRAEVANVLTAAGPRLISLVVQPTPESLLRFPTPPLAEQMDRLKQALR